MAFDEAGNVFVATVGVGLVHVFDPRGELIDSISVPGVRPTNVCFGGQNHDVLYVTLDDPGTIVSIPAGTTGYRLPFCPSAVSDHPWARMLPDRPE
jgi:gluconolactonase